MDVERHRLRERDRLDARNRPQPLQQARRELADAVAAALGHGGRPAQVVGGQQQALGLEAGIGLARFDEALEEQPGDDQHQQRQSHLQRHQAVAHGAAARRLRSGPQRALRIDARQLNRRRGAEQQARADAERDREQQAEAIDAGLEPDRKRAVGGHGPQRLGAPPGNDDAESGAEHAEQQVLGQQQPHDAARTGAEGEPHADFALPRGGAREHEVGGVAAHRQQHQQHHALQDAERGGDHLLRSARRSPVRANLDADVRVGLRKGHREIAHGRRRLGRAPALRWRRRAAGPSPSSRAVRDPRARAIPPATSAPCVAGTHRSNCRPMIVPWKPSGATPTMVSS